MKPDCYQNNGEGILCVYKNPKWLVCIKNWKPDNDIAGIAHLEIHHSTDEQFILTAGKALLITAERENGSFRSIEQDRLCAGLQLLDGEQRLCRPDAGADRRHSGPRPSAAG